MTGSSTIVLCAAVLAQVAAAGEKANVTREGMRPATTSVYVFLERRGTNVAVPPPGGTHPGAAVASSSVAKPPYHCGPSGYDCAMKRKHLRELYCQQHPGSRHCQYEGAAHPEITLGKEHEKRMEEIYKKRALEDVMAGMTTIPPLTVAFNAGDVK